MYFVNYILYWMIWIKFAPHFSLTQSKFLTFPLLSAKILKFPDWKNSHFPRYSSASGNPEISVYIEGPSKRTKTTQEEFKRCHWSLSVLFLLLTV